MIIKKEKFCKETKQMETEYTTDKPGYKVVEKDGKQYEEKMSHDEKRNRFEGQRKEDGNVPKQSRQTQVNNNMAARTRKKQQSKKDNTKQDSKEVLKSSVQEAVTDDIKKAQKRVEVLSNKLKKAKLDQKELTLVQREAEIVKKEKTFKNVEKFIKNDKKKLIDKHSYFTTDNEKDGKTKKLSDKLQKTIDSTIGKQEVVKESILDKVERLCEIINIKKTKKGDVLERLNVKLNEAPKDEEDPLADTGDEGGDDPLADSGEDSAEGGDDPLGGMDAGGGEDGAEADPADGADGEEKDLEDIEDLDEVPEEDQKEPNEVELTVEREEYNVDSNNAYAFYDFMIDRVFTDNAKDALNVEYSNIPEAKRKVMSARVFFDAVVKRLNIDNKAEKKRLEAELEADNEDQL